MAQLNKIKLYKTILLALSIFINLSLIKSQVSDLTVNDHDNYKKSNLSFIITICNFTDTKCKNLRKVFEQIFKKFQKDFNLELKFPFLDSKNLPEKIVSEYTYEGFPVTYFINQSENEKELFLGAREFDRLLKFLKYKLIFPEENLIEANNETEILTYLNKSNDKKALIILGTFTAYSNFSFNLLRKAARKAGIEKVIQIKNEEIIQKYNINEFDLGIFDTKLLKNKEDLISSENIFRLKINKTKKYEIEELTQMILLVDINKNEKNLFSNFSEVDFEYALTYGLPSLFYLFSDKEKQLPTKLEDSLKTVALNYQNDLIFRKGSINSKILKNLKFVKQYNITKNDLPLILITKKNTNYFNPITNKNAMINDDDVEKFILKKSQLKNFVKSFLKSHASSNLDVDNLNFTPEIIQTLIEKIKDQEFSPTAFNTVSELIQMNGENFKFVIDDALKEENTIVLIICPKASKKYNRIRSRVERVFNKIYEANDKKIIFDEFDPLENEISFIYYNYYPSIALIQKTTTVNKWKVRVYQGKLSTYDITQFIKNSADFSVNEVNLDNEAEINKYENENRLNPLHKLRYEGKLFSENIISDTMNIGLKRRWYILKKNNKVISKGEFDELEYPNYYEEDLFSDDFEIDDNADESFLHINEGDEPAPAPAPATTVTTTTDKTDL